MELAKLKISSSWYVEFGRVSTSAVPRRRTPRIRPMSEARLEIRRRIEEKAKK